MVVTVVTVVVRLQNSCAVIQRGWTSVERWYGLHHIAKPIVKCDIGVCGNRGQPRQIFVSVRVEQRSLATSRITRARHPSIKCWEVLRHFASRYQVDANLRSSGQSTGSIVRRQSRWLRRTIITRRMSSVGYACGNTLHWARPDTPGVAGKTLSA